jgi:hypothetical protein
MWLSSQESGVGSGGAIAEHAQVGSGGSLVYWRDDPAAPVWGVLEAGHWTCIGALNKNQMVEAMRAPNLNARRS